MRTLKLALRNVAGSRRGQLGKIFFLGAGLAAGLMLLTKVWFEFSYEDFYPGSDRVYQLGATWTRSDEPDAITRFGISGGYAPYFEANMPQVEASTRFTYIGNRQTFYVGPGRQQLRGMFIMADENLFDVLPRPMLAGNAKETLSRPMYVLISDKLAERIDGDPIGQTIELDNNPGKTLTIGGVFESIPKNSGSIYDAVISLSSIRSFWGYDGSLGMMGNDRYQGYIKLVPGTDTNLLQTAIDRLLSEVEDVKELRQEGGWDVSMSAVPIRDVHTQDPATKRTALVLLMLAAAILFATVFNYLLVVLSDTMARGKSIAVMKSYGAGFREIAGAVFAETVIQVVVLVATACAVIAVFRGNAEQLLGNAIVDLLSWKSGLMLAAVISAIVLISTFVQARVYNNIPVATVFRNYRGTGRKVKLGLLFVQVAAAAFLAMLLVTVIRQYNAMINDDPGYVHENVLAISLRGVDAGRKQSVMRELQSLDVVDRVALGTYLPMSSMGGNNVYDPVTRQDLFNFADLEYGDENYLPLLNVQVVEGQPFRLGVSAPGDALVSRSFVEKTKTFFDWPDGVVGKDIFISQHGEITITGVYEDFKLGTIGNDDKRPSILLYSENAGSQMLIKMKEMGSEPITRVKNLMSSLLEGKEVAVSVYSDQMVRAYRGHLQFRKSISIASIIVMIIVLVGLVGYVKDETVRRQKEIAIRKINGATIMDILLILSGGVMKMMIPALLVGIIVSWYVSGKWMQEFSVKVSFDPFIALLCIAVLAAIALIAVSLSALRIASRNPAETIKTE